MSSNTLDNLSGCQIISLSIYVAMLMLYMMLYWYVSNANSQGGNFYILHAANVVSLATHFKTLGGNVILDFPSEMLYDTKVFITVKLVREYCISATTKSQRLLL